MVDKDIQQLKKKRKQTSTSQEKIAQMLKVTVRTYQRWEKGESHPRGDLTREQIKKVLEIL